MLRRISAMFGVALVVTGLLSGRMSAQGTSRAERFTFMSNGLTLRTGSGVPSSGLGADGDLYVRLDTPLVYQKLSGSWLAITTGMAPGTVTSVGLSLPSIFSVSGSPVTTSGTLSASLATQTANRLFAGPTTGSPAAPTFRTMVLADVPDGLITNAKVNVSAGIAYSKLLLTGGIVNADVNNAAGIVLSKLAATNGQIPYGASGVLTQGTGLTYTPGTGLGVTGTIGVSSPSSPWGTAFFSAIDIGAKASFYGQTNVLGEGGMSLNAYLNSSALWKAVSGAGASYAARLRQSVNPSPVMTWSVASGLTAGDTISWTDMMTVTSSSWGFAGCVSFGGGTCLDSSTKVVMTDTTQTISGPKTFSNLLLAQRTTEQFRVGYDASNYYSTTVGNTGGVTLDAVGSGAGFGFADTVSPSTPLGASLGKKATKWDALYVRDLHVETLVAEDVISTIQGDIVVTPTSTLAAAINDSTTTITLAHNEAAVGDRLLLKSVGKEEWMAVTAGPSGGGPYSYTVTRNLDGSGAHAWDAGDAVANTGTSGDGLVNLFSVDGFLGGAGPSIVGHVRNSATWNDVTPRWAAGNLNEFYGYSSDVYGFAAGRYSNGYSWFEATDANGIRLRSRISSADVTRIALNPDGSGYLANSNVSWDTAGNMTIAAASIAGCTVASSSVTCGTSNDVAVLSSGDATYRFWSGHATAASAPFSVTKAGAVKMTTASVLGDVTVGSGGAIKSGATAFDTGTGYWLDYNGGSPRFRIGETGSGDQLSWDGSELTLISGPLTINGDGISLASGTLASITADLGDVTAGSLAVNNIRLNAGGDGQFSVGAATFLGAPFRVYDNGNTVTENLGVNGTAHFGDGVDFTVLSGAGNVYVCADNSGELFAGGSGCPSPDAEELVALRRELAELKSFVEQLFSLSNIEMRGR